MKRVGNLNLAAILILLLFSLPVFSITAEEPAHEHDCRQFLGVWFIKTQDSSPYFARRVAHTVWLVNHATREEAYIVDSNNYNTIRISWDAEKGMYNFRDADGMGAYMTMNGDKFSGYMDGFPEPYEYHIKGERNPKADFFDCRQFLGTWDISTKDLVGKPLKGKGTVTIDNATREYALLQGEVSWTEQEFDGIITWDFKKRSYCFAVTGGPVILSTAFENDTFSIYVDWPIPQGTIVGTRRPGTGPDDSVFCTDNDGDGYTTDGESCGPWDCNDHDATVYPDAPEIFDSKDNDCDGTVDDGTGSDDVPTCIDNDWDGYALEGGSCGPADCNDTNAAVYPGATELYNNLDDDCDGMVDGEFGTADRRQCYLFGIIPQALTANRAEPVFKLVTIYGDDFGLCIPLRVKFEGPGTFDVHALFSVAVFDKIYSLVMVATGAAPGDYVVSVISGRKTGKGAILTIQ